MMPHENTVAQLLARSPYRRIGGGADVSYPLRFYRGAPASIADLRAGWGVPRPLRVENRTIPLEQFANDVATCHKNTMFVLRAETGEGKTTFLRQLALLLEPKALGLLWHDIRVHDPGVIKDLVKELEAKSLGVVVVAELGPSLPVEVIGQIGAFLTERPLPCPVVLAGARAELAYCSIPGAEHVRFAQLPGDSVEVLIAQLGRLLAETPGGEEIDEMLPNLRRFVEHPDREIFKEGTLLVSLLRATYGMDFRQRLANEYLHLARKNRLAQTIYQLVCYTNAVGLSLPIALLLKLVPGHETLGVVNQFSLGSPWEVADSQDAIMARSPIIAKTVLQESGFLMPAMFEQFLTQVFDKGSQTQEDDVRFVSSLLFGYARWSSTLDSDTATLRGELRKTVRKLLPRQVEWLRGAQETARGSDDWGMAGTWSRLMYHLLPEQLASSPGAKFLIKQSSAWLAIAASRFPDNLQPQIAYFRAKLELKESEVAGRKVAGRLEALTKWEPLLGTGPLGVDYYFDLATCAAREASEAAPGESEKWGRLSARGFEHVLHLAEWESAKVARVLYSKLLHKQFKLLSGRSFVDLLRGAWQTSTGLGDPNPQTGTWLAELLVEQGEQQEAEGVLKKILANVCWGDAILALAHSANSDTAVREYVLSYIRDHHVPEEWGSPLSCAGACYAAAVVQRQQKEWGLEQNWLGKACEYYDLATSANLGVAWPIHGDERWKECVERLQQSGGEGWRGARAKWRKAKEMWDRSKGARIF